VDRRSGILMHITSLPNRFGIGDLGPKAYEFGDHLRKNKQTLWQILPLNPTDPAYDNSPYHSISTFAYNTILISPELLLEEGLLSKDDLEEIPQFDDTRVEYEKVIPYKYSLYQKAFANFQEIVNKENFEDFKLNNSQWLDDFALFVALKHKFGNIAFVNWPDELKRREFHSIESAKRELSEEIEFQKFLQFKFHSQWISLKNYLNQNGILIIGDVPIYVDADSADVWAEPSNFNLDANMVPAVVAGVPPDYFSSTGQLWGNPVYNWDNLRKENFGWWKRRIENSLKLFDFVRIDHFRGLVAFWEVPYGEKTAVNGRWSPVPTYDLFDSLKETFHSLPIIAEDLGIITQDVRDVMKHYELPGMKVLLFAFGGASDNLYLPHNYEKNCVTYTGTHDNNTVKGWFEKEATPHEKDYFTHYIGKNNEQFSAHWEMIRLAEASVAAFSIIPIQDVLGLDDSYRMNTPATMGKNWRFKLPEYIDFGPSMSLLMEMAELYGRD
jgi:4-alpha-glucanotransferase